MTMTYEEILSGLRDLLEEISENLDSAVVAFDAAVLRAAIKTLEDIAPNDGLAEGFVFTYGPPPDIDQSSEKETVYPFKRIAETWHSKAIEWSRENASLRAELERVRGETQMLTSTVSNNLIKRLETVLVEIEGCGTRGIVATQDINAIHEAIEQLRSQTKVPAPSDPAKWEADHQRDALERHGLMDMYNGCDSIDRVCEALVASRALVERTNTMRLRAEKERDEARVELKLKHADLCRKIEDIRKERDENLRAAERFMRGRDEYVERLKQVEEERDSLDRLAGEINLELHRVLGELKRVKEDRDTLWDVAKHFEQKRDEALAKIRDLEVDVYELRLALKEARHK